MIINGRWTANPVGCDGIVQIHLDKPTLTLHEKLLRPIYSQSFVWFLILISYSSGYIARIWTVFVWIVDLY